MNLDEGRTLVSGEEAVEGVLSYFQELLLITPTAVMLDDMELLRPMVSLEDNASLFTVPYLDEVKKSLWLIPVDSSKWFFCEFCHYGVGYCQR